jgi:carbamoyl-phosphate synthase large subunit
MKNILVTGAGAVLGQGILRSLQDIGSNFFIHTADPDHRSSGHWLGNKAHIIKFANDPEYLISVEKILDQEKIDIILIGTDTELPIFALNKAHLEQKYNLKIVVSSINVIEIANDKYLTANFLKSNSFHFPTSYMSYDSVGISKLKLESNYPYIAKPIDGARSKGVELIKDEYDLNRVCSFLNNLVIQEYISDDEGEFTSGCLVFDNKCVAVVTLKRDLRDGNTYRAYYKEEFDVYNSYIAEVAEKLQVEGPCNFQFRIKNGEPVIFEINSRFSGTTPLRSIFGFNEVEACVNYYLDNKVTLRTKLKEGVVMRAWADIFVDEQELNLLNDTLVLNNPNSTYYPFKNK